MQIGPFRELRMKKTALGGIKDHYDTRHMDLRMLMTRACWNNVFGQVQWRPRASWKQRAGWILTSAWHGLFLGFPSSALPKSIWRVSFSGDFILGPNIKDVNKQLRESNKQLQALKPVPNDVLLHTGSFL